MEFQAEARRAHAHPLRKITGKDRQEVVGSRQRQAVKAAHVACSSKEPLLHVHAEGKGVQQIKDELAFSRTDRQMQALEEALDGGQSRMVGLIVQPEFSGQRRGQTVAQVQAMGDDCQPVGEMLAVADGHGGIQSA